ncbi:unannotated protein [freshwater metagenome]|uniref:Unannotated protein n=1 Tax=freshwater metagenome TaxID=449393 RepID=A0A6J7GI90_9ZZZZ
MPIKTMLLTRSGVVSSGRLPPSSPSAIARLARTIWSTISADDKLRVRPACPVAQKGQFMPHPACDDTQSVMRPG